MSSEPAIRARNISKVFELGLTGRTDSMRAILARRLRHPIAGRRTPAERFVALDDISFDVDSGEAVGVIGHNGAGKSTLLKILSRITPPTDGYIDMLGRVGSLLEVGTGFHPELTGIENVYLNGTILGMSRAVIERRLEEIVAFAEVDQFLNTPVKRYSSGMRVRLAFAVAAHLDPDVLIVDEVLSVGDAAFQRKCLTKMKSVAGEQGRTVLYVSHNLVTLENLCPRSMLLVKGRLVFDGPTADTVARYMHMLPHGQRSEIEGVFDLASADRGESMGEAVFQRLSLRPDGGLPSAAVRMGQRLRVEIDVARWADLPPEAVLVVAIATNLDQQVYVMTSAMLPLRALHDRRERETVVLDIASLPLTPGEYTMTLRVTAAGGASIDHVREAAEFTVEPADVLGTGYVYQSLYNGVAVTPWDWELRPTDDEALGVGGLPGSPSAVGRTAEHA